MGEAGGDRKEAKHKTWICTQIGKRRERGKGFVVVVMVVVVVVGGGGGV
jgi:hypothetical protein